VAALPDWHCHVIDLASPKILLCIVTVLRSARLKGVTSEAKAMLSVPALQVLVNCD